MGPVFRGEDGETRDPVVIKVIRVGLTPERVAIVGSALAALKDRLPAHQALAPLIDTGIVDVEPYIVSPFIDGDSLDVALREYGPANMADALPRLRHLADALDAAAAVGTCHGSLHLRDVVVSVDRTVLTGVGIASVLERVGMRPPVRRPYCAPEVALGLGVSPAADQYSLAAVAHEWLTGRRLAGAAASGFQVPASSETGAEALRAVFARAMDESPEGRFPTATAFVSAVAALAEHTPPRSKSSRRAAAVVAPRLSFDDPGDEAGGDDEVNLDGEGDPPQEPGAVDDPFDAPLRADDAALSAAWDADVTPAEASAPFDVIDGDPPDDEPPPALRGRSMPHAPDADAAGGDGVDGVSGARSWMASAALLVLVTAAALAGGWALLRWGTPSAGPIARSTPAEVSTRPAAAPPLDAVQRPDAAPPIVTSRPAEGGPNASAPPPRPPAPLAAATPPTTGRPSPAPPARAEPPPSRSQPATAAAGSGRVLVRSTPGGAEVFVNGERRGVTPLALRDLPFGPYVVRVVRAGFVPVEQRVAIDAGRPARSLELNLTRVTAPGAAAASAPPLGPGSLLVESRPPGARVTIDGVEAGVTPLTLPSVTAGRHTVRIERPGYIPITTTALVEARVRARVAVTLTAERLR